MERKVLSMHNEPLLEIDKLRASAEKLKDVIRQVEI